MSEQMNFIETPRAKLCKELGITNMNCKDCNTLMINWGCGNFECSHCKAKYDGIDNKWY